jgi:hypothetical protein
MSDNPELRAFQAAYKAARQAEFDATKLALDEEEALFATDARAQRELRALQQETKALYTPPNPYASLLRTVRALSAAEEAALESCEPPDPYHALRTKEDRR